MKYTKGESTTPIDKLPQSKLQLMPVPESIWIGVDKDHNVLKNHAVAFFPFESWGAMLPKGLTDALPLIEKGELILHPEAYAEYIKHHIIDADGNHIAQDQRPND